jgi:CheY-like chemotaxis protein
MATILLVEDNIANRVLAAKLLGAAGHEVIEAENGEDGLALARQRHPDLILMDLALPKLDGWETLRLLRADPETATSRVVAVTAHAMVGDRERALEAGFDEYMTKPIDANTFAETVGRQLS